VIRESLLSMRTYSEHGGVDPVRGGGTSGGLVVSVVVRGQLGQVGLHLGNRYRG
jgi:hypothetical protein